MRVYAHAHLRKYSKDAAARLFLELNSAAAMNVTVKTGTPPKLESPMRSEIITCGLTLVCDIVRVSCSHDGTLCNIICTITQDIV